MKEKWNVAAAAWYSARDMDKSVKALRVAVDILRKEPGLSAGAIFQIEEIELVAMNLEAIASIERGFIAEPLRKVAEKESATNTRNGRVPKHTSVTVEEFKEALAHERRRVQVSGKPRGWVKRIEKTLGNSYRKTIKPHLADWGMTEADVERYLLTGEW